MTTKHLQLSGLHCVSCSMVIEGDLEDIGVQAKANYAKQTADVTFDEKNVTLDQIKGVIQKAGYTVISAV